MAWVDELEVVGGKREASSRPASPADQLHAQFIYHPWTRFIKPSMALTIPIRKALQGVRHILRYCRVIAFRNMEAR